MTVAKMKIRKTRAFPGWPPEASGPFDKGRRFPLGDEAVVRTVFPVSAATVKFTAMFEGHPHLYEFKASSARIASQIHSIVSTNIGKTVADLGDFDIELDEA